MGWDKHRRKRSGATPRLSPARMLKATEDPRADLLPCKSASVVGKKHKERAGREASGEKGKEDRPLFLRVFYF